MIMFSFDSNFGVSIFSFQKQTALISAMDGLKIIL